MNVAEDLAHVATHVTVAEEGLRAIIERGTRAPSGDNCQPFRFVLREGGFDVRFDEERATSLLDFRQLSSRLALGALLETMRLAATAKGLRLDHRLDPATEDPALWARVSFVASNAVADGLLSEVDRRCTNRNPFDGSSLASAELQALRGEACLASGESVSCHLRILDERAAIARVARLAGIAERVRAETRRAHEEMHRWLRWTRADAEATRDGLDVETLGLEAVERGVLKTLAPWRRQQLAMHLGASRMNQRYTRRLVEGSSAVGLISMSGAPSDHFDSAVASGVVLQRIWLRATQLGLAMSPMAALPLMLLQLDAGTLATPHVVALRSVRHELPALFDLPADATPFFLFRIGRASPPPIATLRRRVTDVVSR